MTHKKSALIVGCGYVGSQLKKLLHSHNWDVTGIKRSKENGDKTTLSIDIKRKFSLKEKYDFVFYMISPNSRTEECYKEAFEKGVSNTLQALKESLQKPSFIFVSSTSLFAENSGKRVTESSAIETDSFSKKYLNIGEQLVKKSGLHFTVVRFSGIYGPNRYRLIDRLKDGTALLKKNPVISNRIHLADCAGILCHLTTLKERKTLYIASDSHPTPYNDVLIWLSKKLELDPPREEISSKSSRHMSNKICSNELLIQSGYTFIYPSFREGFLANKILMKC